MLTPLIICRASFKKKRKIPSGLTLPKFLSPHPAHRPATQPSLALPTARSRRLRELSSHNSSDVSLASGNGHAVDGSSVHDNKDGGAIDWYMEGPGRRVGYDDLTAIDWIFEYTKERQRLRLLYSHATGLLGHAQQILDASQIWIVLIAAGLLSGVLAASIDVASDWLGDLKTGYCQSGSHGGRFYLNRGFCCWGHQGKIERLVLISPIDKVRRMGSVSRLEILGRCFARQVRSGSIHRRIYFLRAVLRTIICF